MDPTTLRGAMPTTMRRDQHDWTSMRRDQHEWTSLDADRILTRPATPTPSNPIACPHGYMLPHFWLQSSTYQQGELSE
jgi:hypothetical protein